jgi:Flp pilus assembly protein CpaB
MKSISSIRGNPRLHTFLILLASALVGTFTYLYLLDYQSRVANASNLVPVYVAGEEIAAGTSYGEISGSSMMRVSQMPSGSIPSEALTPSSALDPSLKARGSISSGQFLISSDFTSESRTDVGLPIPKGMLAITITADDVSRVGNFVSPGSRVVIFATTGNGSGNTVTSLLLPDALVISIGSQTQINNDGNQVIASPLVTLALPPTEARTLISASQSARLTLALAYQNDPLAVISPERDASTSSSSRN